MNHTLLNSILLFAGVILSGGTFFFFKSSKPQTLKLILSFSGAYLFAISVLRLLPEVYQSPSNINPGVLILVGFFFQLLLDYFSEGIEHGHIHVHKEKRLPWGMMISLCIHAFFESIPVGAQYSEPSIQESLVMGILVHNIPISFALVSVIRHNGISVMATLACLGLFALMSPAGILTAHFFTFQNWPGLGEIHSAIMAFVIGIFLHISTTILFESSENHRFNLIKLSVISAGVFVALFTGGH